MDDVIMTYFEGLTFRMHLETPDCRAWCRKRFGYYVLDYAHSGRVAFSLDGSRQRVLQAPVAWWTWPGPLFSFGALRGESWHHHFVSFQGPRAARMLRTGLFPPRPEPWGRPRQPEDFRARMLELFACLEAPAPDDARAAHLLEGLLLELQRPAPDESDQLSAAMTEFSAAMRRRPAAEADLADWAARAGCSLVHFRRKFRERFGSPPGRFLQGLRLERAADRLRSGREAVKEIAASVGIADVLYFTRLFKRRFGLPPARYRREHQEWAEAT
jgi:AraC-like DNA-binding protein